MGDFYQLAKLLTLLYRGQARMISADLLPCLLAAIPLPIAWKIIKSRVFTVERWRGGKCDGIISGEKYVATLRNEGNFSYRLQVIDAKSREVKMITKTGVSATIVWESSDAFSLYSSEGNKFIEVSRRLSVDQRRFEVNDNTITLYTKDGDIATSITLASGNHILRWGQHGKGTYCAITRRECVIITEDRGALILPNNVGWDANICASPSGEFIAVMERHVLFVYNFRANVVVQLNMLNAYLEWDPSGRYLFAKVYGEINCFVIDVLTRKVDSISFGEEFVYEYSIGRDYMVLRRLNDIVCYDLWLP